MTMYVFLKYVLMSGSTEGSWVLTSVPTFCLLWYVIFTEADEGNSGAEMSRWRRKNLMGPWVGQGPRESRSHTWRTAALRVSRALDPGRTPGSVRAPTPPSAGEEQPVLSAGGARPSHRRAHLQPQKGVLNRGCWKLLWDYPKQKKSNERWKIEPNEGKSGKKKWENLRLNISGVNWMKYDC